jgi:hypothetical protein
VSKNLRSMEEIVRDIEKLRDEVQVLVDNSPKLTEETEHASSNDQASVSKII